MTRQRLPRVVMINYAQSTQEVTDWAEFLPTTFGIAAQSAGINFQDNIRAGLEKDVSQCNAAVGEDCRGGIR